MPEIIYDTRRQMFVLIVGIPGCGKTTDAIEVINATLSKNKPVLIVLANDDEEAFHPVEELAIDYKVLDYVLRTDEEKVKDKDRELYDHKLKYVYRCFRQHRSGIKKVYCTNPKLFDIINGDIDKESFKHGLLVLDDARTYLGSRDEPFRRTSMRKRQMNVDILFLCHGFSEFPRSINSYITDIILHETQDDYDLWNIANKHLYVDYVDRVNAAAKKNTYHSERIILRNTKIVPGGNEKKKIIINN